MGRVDDVINVSGHRLGTMEVESALVAHPLVAEADSAAAGSDSHQTGFRDPTLLWHFAGCGDEGREPGSCGSRWTAGGAQALASDGKDHPWRSGAV